MASESVANNGLISVVGLCVNTLDASNGESDRAEKAARAELCSRGLTALTDAQLVIGSSRQLAAVAHVMNTRQAPAHCIPLPRLSELQALLDEHVNKRIVMLASGDPLHYGIGRWLGQHVEQQRLRFIPAVSSIQTACSRIGLSLQDVRVVSLHGRPVETLRTQLHDGVTLLVLTDQHSHPARLARECVEAGMRLSTLTVFEMLGYPEERIRQFELSELMIGGEQNPQADSPESGNACLQFAALNVVLIQVAGAPDDSARYLPVFPGIPDHCFMTGAAPGKGMITKREARLVILSYLSPGTNEIIWDIGAGCGGVAVELAYWNARTTVYAVEHHADRTRYLHENCQRFGVVGNLNIVQARAPECLDALPKPDKVFIGGSDGELELLLKRVWGLLPAGGVLVASAVTQGSRSILGLFAGELMPHQVESVELSVNRGALRDGAMQYTAKLPVEIFRFCKLPPLGTKP